MKTPTTHYSLLTTIFRHPLFSGSALMVGGNMVVNGVNYFYHVVMGRILGPSDYGELASIFSIFYIISIVPVSSSFAIVKFISEAETGRERRAVYLSIKGFVIKVAILGSLAILLLAPFIQGFLKITDSLSILFVSPVFFLSLVILIEQAAMQGVLKFIGVVGPNFFWAVGKLILGIILVLAGFSVAGAIGGVLGSAILTYFMARTLSRGLFENGGREKFEIKNFLKFAFPVLLQALAFTSIFTVDVILAKHFLSAFEAGLYAALSTLGKIIFFATQPITATMFPIVSGRRARGEKYKPIFFGALLITFVASLSISIFYYLFPEIAIGVLYGSEYLSAVEELVWMGAFVGIYSLSSLVVNFLLSINRTKVIIIPILASLIQVVGIIIWHGSILQIIQVSLGATLALFVSLALYLLLEWSKRNYSLS